MSTLALKGPYWVTVRQYRRTLWLVGAAVTLSLLVIGGLRIWDAQTPDRFFEDGQRYPADNRGYDTLRTALDHGGMWLLLLPLLVGAFVAGPLVAREFESGTYKLSLTQSVTPAAWLRSKLLTASAVALAAALALIGVYRIGWNRVSDSYNFHWSESGPYEATGIVLLAYVLLGVAVGALVGQLIRRTLVAMAVTGGAVGLALLTLGAFRWDFLAVRTVTGPAVENASAVATPDNGMFVGQGLLGASGRRLPGWFCTPDTPPGAACRPDEPVTAQYLDYHPESHFWPTQLIESGIVLALALAAYAAFRVLRARHP
ncbi:ABC transporter permease subunit [Streptomyces sp. TX20-6-3]|uniref:ABC transporter permease subunit n=1 Tax=Streptomyces sp. TX20-6-3 TaxID=3028705 RepID=UPI0029A0275E|nr:ABC transporter permease subunit [Streptomyces sp. TX20-6-3]MDX2560354.1 ABC transporter permease subunit [Streptomyces sp. TX20-6-3]